MRPFPGDALDTNRRGALTGTQRDALARPLRLRNMSATIMAAVLFAVGVGIGFMAPPALSAIWRIGIVGIALGIAASLILRIVTGADRALSRDLRR